MKRTDFFYPLSRDIKTAKKVCEVVIRWWPNKGKKKKKQTAQNVRELCYSSTSALLSQPLADNRGPGRVY